MIKEVVNKIRSLAEGMDSPAYPFYYTTHNEMNQLIMDTTLPKFCVLISWVEGSQENKANGLFPEYKFFIFFARKQNAQELIDNLLDIEENAELDLFAFTRLVEKDSTIEFTDQKRTTYKITDKYDDSYLLVGMEFKIKLTAGASLSICV
jgi:hypothetical protein